MRRRLARAVALLVAAACTSQNTRHSPAETAASLPAAAGPSSAAMPADASDAPPVLTAAERAAGWRALFDGRTTAGWRGYGRSDMPAGWVVRDGMLIREAAAADIITTETFGDFELALDWMVREGGNSGVFYRAVESGEPIYYSAPEMQVLDDARHPDGQSPLTSAGSVYGLYPATRGVVRPAGEWNAARVVVTGNHVAHWLNGVKVAEYDLHSPDWKARVAASKFREWPAYGQAAEGHIGLQEHGDWVAFRNIRIRERP